MTTKLNSKSRGRGATVAGLGGLALASVLLLCGAGNAPIENFTPQGAMQADFNAGGHNLTNAATVNATNVAASNLNATSAMVGSLTATNLTVNGALTATNFTLPYANLSGNPVTVAAGKTLGASNSLTLAGTDGSTLNVGAGGTLGSAAFAATNAFLAPSAIGTAVEGYDATILKSASIGTTVQGYNANTTTLGNSVNGTNTLVQTDGNGLLLDTVLRPAAKLIYVSQGRGIDTRTGLSKYSAATPFATLTAAAAAASAGDTIVAEDGTFTDKNITLVTGVNWLFLPGATITVTGASNNDTIFKDGGTAATVDIGGFGQTLAINSTAASSTLYGVQITAGSTLTVSGLNVLANETSATGTAAALSSANSSANLTFTGNLTASGGSSASAYGVYFNSPGGGTVTVNGNVSGSSTGNGYGFYSNSTGGSLTVSQKITGSSEALSNSSTSTVSCASISETFNTSVVNNHLTLLSPVPVAQSLASPSTGFSTSFQWGSQDTILYITPTGTLASGTVTLPADNSTRLGQRLTISTTQTITSLSVSVTSGTIYGYSTGTLNAGSISFVKIASNVWTKL